MTTAVAKTFSETSLDVADVHVQLRSGGQGAPLLILHSELGVPGWLQAYEELAQHFTVYVPSLPGFGQSSRPDWITGIRDLAAWVTWFTRDMQLPRPMAVMGFSMGGWVAAEIATLNAAIFSKMVLVAPAGLKPEIGEIWDYFAHNAREAFAQAFHDPAQAPEYARYYGGEWTREMEAQVEGNREMAARLLWKPYMRSRTLQGLLRGVATPTLLLWGQEDTIIPPDTCQIYQQVIPGAVTRFLEHCGHVPEMERPTAFVQAVLPFLQGGEATP